MGSLEVHVYAGLSGESYLQLRMEQGSLVSDLNQRIWQEWSIPVWCQLCISGDATVMQDNDGLLRFSQCGSLQVSLLVSFDKMDRLLMSWDTRRHAVATLAVSLPTTLLDIKDTLAVSLPRILLDIKDYIICTLSDHTDSLDSSVRSVAVQSLAQVELLLLDPKLYLARQAVVKAMSLTTDTDHLLASQTWTYLLSHQRGTFRRDALTALGHFAVEWREDASLLAAMEECLSFDDPRVRHSAEEALKRVQTRSKWARLVWDAILLHLEDEVRLLADATGRIPQPRGRGRRRQ